MADKPDLLEAAADMLCEAAIGYGARGMSEKADKCCKVAAELRARVGEPDDGEPVTEDWLRSVATEMYDENTFVFMIAHGVDRGEDGDEPWFQAAFVQLGCWWFSDGYQDSFTVEWNNPTRGHVRRLCQALGIALPAAPAEGGG